MEQASLKNIFRTLVIAQVLLWLVIVYALPPSFIALQREFRLPDSYVHVSTPFGRSLEFLFYAQVIANLVMLGFWNASRYIYMVLAIADMAVVCFDPIIVRSGLGDALATADGVLTGLILAMIYFSPLREAFADSHRGIAVVAVPPPFPPPPVPAPPAPGPGFRPHDEMPPWGGVPGPQPTPSSAFGKPAGSSSSGYSGNPADRGVRPTTELLYSVKTLACGNCGATEQDGRFCTQCGGVLR